MTEAVWSIFLRFHPTYLASHAKALCISPTAQSRPVHSFTGKLLVNLVCIYVYMYNRPFGYHVNRYSMYIDNCNISQLMLSCLTSSARFRVITRNAWGLLGFTICTGPRLVQSVTLSRVLHLKPRFGVSFV